MSLFNRNSKSRRTVSGVLFCAKEILGDLPNASLDAELLLGDVLGMSRVELRINGDLELSWRDRRRFMDDVKKRRKGVPLAYIRGWKEWSGMRIRVCPDVLIPRDETEYLLEKIIEDSSPKSVLDIGTGSGCIAVKLAKSFPNALVMALDYSLSALRVARRNFKRNKVHVLARHSDLLSAVEEGAEYDLIVANLPYVPVGMDVSVEVSKEPSEAIFSGEDGLDLLRRLAGELRNKKIKFKSLWLEFLPKQWPEVQKVFSSWGVVPVKDIGGDIYFARVFPLE